MSIPRKKFGTPVKALDLDDNDFLDRCDAAYQEEYIRWYWRRGRAPRALQYEVVRSASVEADVKVTTFSKRECADRHEAEAWLRTYRQRAAMRAALEAI